jgi:hypothetical protein
MSKIQKTKLMTAFSLILLLTIAMALASFLPAVQAYEELPTFIELNVAPNPVGQGQTAYVNVFLSKPPPGAGLGGAGEMYEGITVEMVRPDGNKQVFGKYRSDPTGGAWFSFTPDQVGEYTLQAFYPGQWFNASASYDFLGNLIPGYQRWYKPSSSSIVNLTVQQQPIPPHYIPPLPTEYWSRPIYATNYAWAQLGGSWFGLAAPAFATTGVYDAMGNVQLYTTAPNTGHIVWTKPTHFGGQVGLPISGDQMSQYMSTTIASNFFEPIILNGILYYTHFAGPNAQKASWDAVDIRTGEPLWTREPGETGNEVLKMGQILRWHSIQEYGSWAFLYGTESAAFFGVPTFLAIYDPMTGEWIANITSIRSAQLLMDLETEQQGTLLGYYTQGGNLTMWNSTKLMMSKSFDKITIRPSGTYNWTVGNEWSVPLPTTVGTTPIGRSMGIGKVTSEVILLRYQAGPGGFTALSYGYQITAGYDAKTGQKLWGPINQTLPLYHDMALLAARDGVYVLHDKDTDEAYGYSLKTGEKLWGPVALPGNAWSHISVAAEMAYGKVFIWDFGAYVNALNATTGKIEWTLTPRSAGYDTSYGVYPIWEFGTGTICDGKLFLSESHMYDPPLFPGAQRLAINCTTGELVWSILSFSGRCPAAHADGYMVQWNSYDSQIYTFGKGPTATTVTVPDTAQPLGTQVLVKGTVTDQSPGTKDSDRTARFPNGVPAVSDDSMSPWMEYVYMQQPRPTNATGVEVTLDTLDPNGNFVHIGTVTSDSSSMFKKAFVPEVPGEYTIIATFAGSESYWPSYAETAISVSEAPPATPPPQYPIPADYTLTIIAAAIAIIIAVAIATILILRKRV